MIEKGKPTEVTIKHKTSNEEFTFTSINKASEYMGISAVQLSRIIKKTTPNVTKYYVTTD